MASIGSINFVALDWSRSEQAETMREVTRPGSNGVAFQRIGQRSRPTRGTTFADYATKEELESQFVEYAKLKGTLQDIVDDFGNVYISVAILDVIASDEFRVITPSGGLSSGQWVLVAEWILQTTNTNKVTP